MSNEQTVRDYTTRQAFHLAEAAHRGNVTNTVIDRVGGILGALGIDPDMTVSELQRRLRIAERVLTPEFAEWTGRGVLAWLTREDDQ